ncbi:MAG TPA: 50S ribosomal protein L25 [Desulfohalobiaceae bacterium]|nr:50S ribosomal protein L25 [Desulfohalobiaceae bacterium]
MTEFYELQAEKRFKKGKGANRQLRRNGKVPGIYYNKKGENIPLEIKYGPFESVFEKAHKSNIVELSIQDGQDMNKRPVLIWGVHEHPVKNLILHVDFLGVDLKKEIDVDVQIQVTGQAIGEEKGGIVSIFRDMVSVTCLPTAIPDELNVDVTDLDINDNIYIQEMVLPSGVRLKDVEEDFAIVGVLPPATEIEAEEEGMEEGSGPGSEEQE